MSSSCLCSILSSFILKPNSTSLSSPTYASAYVKLWMYSCDLVKEEMLADLCLYDILEDYYIFLGNLSLFSFSKLMKAARRTHEIMHRSSQLSSTRRSSPNFWLRKRPIVGILHRGVGSRSFRPALDRRGPRKLPTLSPFPYDPKKATTL